MPLIFLIASIDLLAQLDTRHYIPPFYGREDRAEGGGDDIYLIVSTPKTTPFQVKVTDGAGVELSFSPLTVSRTAPVSVALSTATGASKGPGTKFLVTDAELATVLSDEGLVLTANKAFFASIRVDEGAQAGFLTSKGTAGFGTEFRSGHIFNTTGEEGRKAHVLSFMATENNTLVTVSDYDNVDFQNVDEIGGTISVSLDAGQSYVLAAFANVAPDNLNNVNGTRISSDKAIVVNSGSWLAGSPGAGMQGRDIGIDQIASIEETGFEYILVKGEGTTNENVIVVAHTDGTNIFLNGATTPENATPLAAGDYYRLTATDYSANQNMYISANQPIYVYQGLNGSVSDNERQLGLNYMPPIVCLGGTNVDLPDIDQLGNPVIQVIAELGAAVSITDDGGTTTDVSGMAQAVTGNSDYVTYKLTGYSGDVSVQSPRPIRVSLTIESGNVGGAGFFSGFTTAPVLETPNGYDATTCIPDNLPVTLTASGFDDYQWYRDGIELSGENFPDLSVNGPGEYTATGTIAGCQFSEQSFQLAVSLCPGDVGIAKNIVSTTNVSGSIFDVVFDLIVTNFSTTNPAPNLQITDAILSGLPSGATATLQVSPALIAGSFSSGGISATYDGDADQAILQTSDNASNTELTASASATIRFTVRVDMSAATSPAYTGQAIVSTAVTAPNDGFTAIVDNQDFSDAGTNPDENGNGNPTEQGENDITQVCLSNNSLSYATATYYSTGTDPLPVVSGLTGGTFSAPIGLAIHAGDGSIDLSASIVDTYQVIYAFGGLCPVFTSVEIALNPPAEPTVDIQISSNDLLTITGSAVLNPGFIFSVLVDGITYTLGDGNLSISGTTWSLAIPSGNELSPDGFFEVQATIDDGAGNILTDTTTNEITLDTGAPVVDILGEPGAVSNVDPYTVTIEFTEDVFGFDVTDIIVANGSKANFTSIDASTFAIEITPDGNGDVTIDVPAGAAQDAAGNDNLAATQATTFFDDASPTVAITGEPAIVANTDPYDVTIDFGESVSGFDLSDIIVANGSATAITDNGDGTFTVEITPDGNGNITIDVPAGAAQDAAGNDNLAATQATTIFDDESPTVAITGEPAIVANTDPYDVTIDFGELVSGFDLSDIIVANGSATAVNDNGDGTFTVSITPDGNGDVTIDVPAGAAQDAAGNDNLAATQATTFFDDASPTVAITGEPAIVANTDPYDVTIDFGESVSGFDLSDIIVANGSATAITDNGDGTFTVEITPDGNGNITIDVPAGAAQDAAGNDNLAATQATTIFDDESPTVAITGEPAIVANTDPYDVTIDFGELVSGFDLSDIIVANGSATAVNDNGDGTFTVSITPDGNGDVTIDVPAGAAQDAAGNDNLAATQATTFFDDASPTVAITGEPAIVANTDPYDVTIDFGESVSGFDLSDIIVANGSATAITDNGDGTFTVEITPDGNGNITIDVPAGAAQDAAGNDNLAATQATTIFDDESPTVAITGEPAIVANTDPYDVTIDFGELVSGFDLSDIIVANGSATAVNDNGDGTFTVSITPDGNGDITVDVPAGASQDAAGNDNLAATQATTFFDDASPTVTITGEPAIVANTDPYDVTIDFGELVSGFDLSDIIVANGSATAVNDNGDGTFTVEITPDGNGDITIDVPAGAAQDAAGNDNLAATQATTIFDDESPTVAITGEPAIVANTDPYDVTIDFGELVSGFDLSDIIVANGSATAVNDNGDGTFTVEITPDGNGDITIYVPAGAAQDAAGNDNLAATQATTIFDDESPTVAITGEPAIVANTDPYDVTIDFGESVSGFDLSDIIVANGSATAITDNGDGTFTVEITPDGNGDVTIDVPAGASQDAAGNDNLAATQATTFFDDASPTVAITGEPAIVANTDPYDVTIDFGESVSGFDLSDIIVANGSATAVNDNGDGTFTVEITPDGNGDITIDVPAGAAQDAAGNDNLAATQATTIFDDESPTVAITGEPAIVANTDPYDVTIDFGELVSGFDLSDIIVANGSATAVNDNGDGTFTVEITPDGNGDITIYVPAGAAQDAAGNDNLAATQATTIFDDESPTVAITGEPAIVANTDPYDVTIDFGESVSGFDLSDIIVANGSATAITDNGDGTFTVEITPDGNGDVTIDVPAGASQDAAGNDNLAATQATTFFDDASPTVAITGEPAIVANTDPYDVTIDFGESVSGFDLSDIIVANGSATAVNDNGDGTFTVEITPDGNGNITIDVPAGASQDAAGNDNLAATQATTIFDDASPTVAITGEPAIVANTDPYDVTIDFGESVSGFDLSDIIVANGSATAITDNGDGTFTVEITPDGNGDVTIDVPAGASQDAAGNDNLAATQATTFFDDASPTVAITGEPAIVANTDPYDVTIDFGESVSGFDLSDIIVANGSATAVNDNGDGTFTVEITPDGNGNITIDVPAGASQDAAGNDNLAATQATTIFDDASPTVAITGEPAIVANTDPYDVTIDFGESVSGFDLSDIIVANGSATAITDNGDGTFTVEITPDGNGDITIDVPAGASQDAAGNDNLAATQATTIFDDASPTVAITGEPAIKNSTNPYDVTIDFDELVSGFDLSDILVANGSATAITDNGDGTFTVAITPDGNGDITIDIPAGAAQDAAGNDNLAATQAITVFDAGAPSVDITGEPAIVANTDPYDVTIDFGELVSGFDLSDIIVANGSATAITDNGDGTFTVAITPDGNGDITIDVPAGAAQDAAGNDNLAATQATTIFDDASPTVAITGEPAITNSTNPYDVTIDFDELVSGFDLSDILVANGSATAITDNGDGTFTVAITPDGNGDITVDVPAGAAQDAAGNDNLAATQATTIFDDASPTVAITGEPAIVANTDPYDVTIDFGESVSGFDLSDIIVANGSATAITDNGDGTFTVAITPDGNGDITIDVPAGAAQDAAGNDNLAATQAITVFDDESPTVAITGEPAIVANTDPYDVTIDFGESVSGFDLSDIIVANGSATAVNDNGDGTFTVSITPDGNGDITIDIPAGAAQDAAGNDNPPAIQALTIFDNLPPMVAILDAPLSVNSLDEFTATVSFSELVTGFELQDIELTNATLTNVMDNGDGTFTISMVPDGMGDIALNISADVASDLAGNGNTAAEQVVIEFISDQPQVEILDAPVIINTQETYTVTIAFNEIITGFELSEIAVVNGVSADFIQMDDSTFTVSITPDGAGDITISIAEDVAENMSGTGNAASLAVVTILDMEAPEIPTVNDFLSNDGLPILTGTWAEGDAVELSLSLSARSFALGIDQELSTDGNGNWSLDLSSSENPLAEGIYDVLAVHTDLAGNASEDNSEDELMVIYDAPLKVPTVNALTSENGRPLLTGTWDEPAATLLSVAVNAMSYDLGTSLELNSDGSGNWPLTLVE